MNHKKENYIDSLSKVKKIISIICCSLGALVMLGILIVFSGIANVDSDPISALIVALPCFIALTIITFDFLIAIDKVKKLKEL